MDDPYLSQLSDNNSPSKPSKKRFDRPTDRLKNETVRETTTAASSQAGQYDRKTLTFRPEVIARVREIGQRERVGLLAMFRWLVDMGLEAYDRGERPEPAEPLIHQLKTDIGS